MDLQNARMRAVSEAMVALAPDPDGFTVGELAEKTRGLMRDDAPTYSPRRTLYNMSKLREKVLLDRVYKDRCHPDSWHTHPGGNPLRAYGLQAPRSRIAGVSSQPP